MITTVVLIAAIAVGCAVGTIGGWALGCWLVERRRVPLRWVHVRPFVPGHPGPKLEGEIGPPPSAGTAARRAP